MSSEGVKAGETELEMVQRHVRQGTVGQGRLLPTTSVDQYAATLASWFGVSDSDMSTVLPYIGNYTTRNLGFV